MLNQFLNNILAEITRARILSLQSDNHQLSRRLKTFKGCFIQHRINKKSLIPVLKGSKLKYLSYKELCFNSTIQRTKHHQILNLYQWKKIFGMFKRKKRKEMQGWLSQLNCQIIGSQVPNNMIL